MLTKCEKIIKACVVLLNFIQSEEESVPINQRHYFPPGYIDERLLMAQLFLGCGEMSRTLDLLDEWEQIMPLEMV